jgi:RNA polymerase sigma factor (TIGR02999 family)
MLVEPKSRAKGAASRSQPSEAPLEAIQHDHRPFDRLFTLVYNNFRDLAKSYLAREPQPHTLQPTALVNEAYLKLVDQKQVDWKNRSHVLAVGAIAMRRILVNHAIAAKRQKRGGAAARITLHEDLISTERDLDVLAIDQALDDLAKLDERHAKIVELRFFGGLSVPEVASVLGVSVSTVEKDWRFCSAWLRTALRP